MIDLRGFASFLLFGLPIFSAEAVISHQSVISTEGRIFTDEWSRQALSWPYSRASMRFQGSSYVSAVLENSGFETSKPHAHLSFAAGSVKEYQASLQDGLLKLTVTGLDTSRPTVAVLTKLSESDEGEALLYRFEIDTGGRWGLHSKVSWPVTGLQSQYVSRCAYAAFLYLCHLSPQSGVSRSLVTPLG